MMATPPAAPAAADKPPLALAALNADKKAAIYLTGDPGRNTLTLTLTNQTGRSLVLKGGAPVPEEQLDSGGPTSLYLTLGDLLDPEQFKDLRIAAPRWQATYFGGTPATWALAPQADTTLADRDAIDFAITNILATGQPRPGTLAIDRYNVPGVDDDVIQLPLFVQNPPAAAQELRLNYGFVGSDTVYVTDDDAHAIANELVFNLSNPSPDTALVASGTPVFNLSFVCGERPGYGALATAERVAKFALGIAEQYRDRWTVSIPNLQGAQPYWQLLPQGQEILGTGAAASVEFSVGNIITELEPGITFMYLQYANIPGFNDGYYALRLRKEAPKPGIQNFWLDRANVDMGDAVKLSWRTFAATRVRLSYQANNETQWLDSDTGQIQLNQDGLPLTPLQPETTYTLYAYDADGSQVHQDWQQTVTCNVVAITDFRASREVVAVNERVTLTWATKYADYCLLTPGNHRLRRNSDSAEPYAVVSAVGQDAYKLTAWTKRGFQSQAWTLPLTVVQPPPAPFPAPPFDLGEDPLEAITARSGSEWAAALVGNDSWAVKEGHFNADDQCMESIVRPNSHGELSVQIQGPTVALDCVSYVAIGGPSAGDVDAMVYPPKHPNYQGWTGSGWADGPAINSNGFYWYRVAVRWVPPFEDPTSIFYARHVRHTVRPAPFKVWAFRGL